VRGADDLLLENKDIFDWICDVDPLVDHKRILEGDKLGSDYAHSGQWLFDLPDFLKWSSSDAGAILALWLHGPGKLPMSSTPWLQLLRITLYPQLDLGRAR